MKSSTDRVEYYGVVANLAYPLPLLSPSPWPTCKKLGLQIHVTVMKSSANTPPGEGHGPPKQFWLSSLPEIILGVCFG